MPALSGVLAVAALLASSALPGSSAAASTPPRWVGTSAAPAAGISTPEPVPAQAACTITDRRLAEISGMVVTDRGILVVNDGDASANEIEIFRLDDRCRVADVTHYPRDPYDTEDMALGPDGTVWVADTGDNDRKRPTVALWRLSRSGETATRYRFTYPDGKHDAEALLFDGDGTPLIITKDFGVAGIYRPAGALRPEEETGTPLEKVGQFLPRAVGTDNPFGFFGAAVVTGAARSPDGSRVVLRTYSDAYEFDVSGGDVIAALSLSTPRVTPLPNEPQGEAITYAADGSGYLTVSERTGRDIDPVVLRYLPDRSGAGGAAATATPAVRAGSSGGQRSLGALLASIWRPLTFGIGAAGTLLVLLGTVGALRMARRRRHRHRRSGGGGAGRARSR